MSRRADRRRREKARRTGRWLIYYFGRTLQVTGLVMTLVAATAFFGTPSTTAMLRMMLVGVLFFVPGWLIARRHPGAPS